MFSLSPQITLRIALALGTVFRLFPLFDPSGRLWQQWPTEDGYLTLTIARNIARGHGFSVAAGTIPTNGTQPLATSIYSIGFWLFGGQTTPSLLFAQLFELVVGLGVTFLLYRFVMSWLSDRQDVQWIAALSASIWYLSPILVPHSMNCLETGISLALQLAVLLRWYGPATRAIKMSCHDSLISVAVTGLLMGLLAYARLDNAFFLVALAGVHFFVNSRRGQGKRALLEVFVMGLVTSVAISPWLLFGKLSFGHWVPISGVSEGHFSEFGENARLLPAILFEYAFPLFGVPSALEARLPTIIFFIFAVGAWIAFVVRYFRGREQHLSAPVILFGALALLYGGYYGFFFGAGHFLSRYLAPLSTFSIPLFVLIAADQLKQRQRWIYPVAAASCIVLIGQQVRLFLKGERHQHAQVVEWVRENVPDEVWVGAYQSGTLGFFHDRSINFDGKVDPRSLDARLADRTHEFVVESKAQAIVDWAGFETLIHDGDIISDNFHTLLLDSEQNLVVLIRTGGLLDTQNRKQSPQP